MSTSTNVGSSAAILKIAFIIFAITLLVLNGGLTAQFGWVYGGGAFAAIFLVLNFDAAGLAWYTARLQEGLSGPQRAIAKLMSVVTILSSVIVSVIAVLLSFQLVDLTEYAKPIGITGTWLVVVVCGLNTIALFCFQMLSVSERKIEQKEELAAQTADQIQEMTVEAHTKAMTKARTTLMGKTDKIGARLALDVERDFLRQMDCLDLLEEPAAYTATDQGAVAGAKEVLPVAPDPTPTLATNPDCSCGMPVGRGAGFCDYEIGGPGCMIDLKAAEEKAERGAMEPLDLTTPFESTRPAEEIAAAEAAAAERLGK